MISSISFSSLALLALGTLTLSHPLASVDDSASKAQTRLVAELPKPSWLENIAVRSNGDLLVTRLDVPLVYSVNPITGKYSVIATFEGVTAAFGIVEYRPDVFAVGIGNFSLATLSSTPGSYSLQTLDLTKGLGKDGKVTPKLLSAVKDAQNLNGLTFSPPCTLYSSDSDGFKIYGIDTRTGQYSVAVDSQPLLSIVYQGAPLGINGLRWSEKEQSLIFANSNQALLGIISRKKDGTFAPAQKLADNAAMNISVSSFDDFALDSNGNVFATTNPGNTLNFVSSDGKRQYILAGSKNSTELAEPTSAAFGRTPADKDTVYVVTAGGEAAPIGGTTVVGAQIVAVKLSK